MTFVLIATNSKQVRQNAYELLAIAISTRVSILSYLSWDSHIYSPIHGPARRQQSMSDRDRLVPFM
jgi:hypothetical protein